jgi:hypothetical protein
VFGYFVSQELAQDFLLGGVGFRSEPFFEIRDVLARDIVLHQEIPARVLGSARARVGYGHGALPPSADPNRRTVGRCLRTSLFNSIQVKFDATATTGSAGIPDFGSILALPAMAP